MKKYYILPERGKWIEAEAATAEAAYTSICCWYNPGDRIAVIEADTRKAEVFTRTLDDAGNLQAINKHL